MKPKLVAAGVLLASVVPLCIVASLMAPNLQLVAIGIGVLGTVLTCSKDRRLL